MEKKLTNKQAIELIGNRMWRLNHLYKIKTKDRKLQILKLNYVQEIYCAEETKRDIILKARQLGFSTLKLIQQLDYTIFNRNTNSAVIANQREKVQVLFEIVRLAYEHFPNFGGEFRKPQASYDNRNELYFPELNSKIFVSVDTRGETIHNLHVSELAYIERAEEKMLGILESVPKDGIISFESTGNGTCYDEKTEVLTDNGWKLFSNLSKKDGILTMNPENNEAFFEYKWIPIKESYNGKIIRFLSQKIDLAITPNHNLFVKLQKGKWKFKKAIELLKTKTDIYFRKNFDIKGKNVDFFVLPSYAHKQGNGVRIENEKKIKIDDWLEYFGYFLSEGNVVWIKGNKRVTITQQKFFRKMKECCERIAKQIGAEVYCRDSKISIINSQLANYLKNYSQPKRIPREILNLDKILLKILADAIYMGDGDLGRGTKYGRVFTGMEKELSDSLQELYLRIGYSSSIMGKENNQITTFSKKKVSLYETYKNKVFEENYKGFVYCVNLPKYHLLFVRRNGKAIWCGNSGYFYQTWEDSKSEFYKHFYPWTLDNEYFESTDKTFEELIQEYIPLQIKYELIPEIWNRLSLTREQFAWYIAKIRRHKEKVKQEYPSNPLEAFVSSGRNIFSFSDLLKHPIRDPIDRKYQDLMIWEHPLPGQRYSIGCDPSEGIGEDNSVIEVLNAYTGEQVAEFATSYIPPDTLAGYLIEIGIYYNKAIIVPEINSHGISVRDRIKTKYENIYRRQIFDKITNRYTESIGWKTTSITKPLLVDSLEEAVRNQDILIHSEKAISEMKTFVRTDEQGRQGMGAEGSNKDDRVIALGLALQGIKHLPKMKAPKTIAQKKMDEFIEKKNLEKLGYDEVRIKNEFLKRKQRYARI